MSRWVFIVAALVASAAPASAQYFASLPLAKPKHKVLPPPHLARGATEGPALDAPALPPPTSGSREFAMLWARGEYLAWCVQGAGAPPLVTQSVAGTPRANAGVLGTQGTRTIFGDHRLADDFRSGFRFEAGSWFDANCRLGVSGSLFVLGSQADGFTARSTTGATILGRPFVNALTGAQAAELVSFPGVLAGAATVSARTSNVLGADALARTALICRSDCDSAVRLEGMAGYRYLALDDRLRVREDLAPLAAPFVPGTSITVTDSFTAQNRFHGGVLGLGAFYSRGCFTAEMCGRADLGCMERRVTIGGSTVTATPGAAPVVSRGGLLAQTTNGGTFRSTAFTVVPELDLRVGWRATGWLRLTAGYTLIVLTDVARAGGQIDPVVNPNLLPGGVAARGGPARPAFTGSTTDVWVQGVSVGAVVSW